MKHTHVEIKHLDRTNREIEFIASKQEVDRDGDVVLIDGIDISRFQRNPVMLLDHDRLTRFARVTRLDKTNVEGVKALVGTARVLPAGASQAADEAYAQILAGVLNGISIGFLVVNATAKKVLPGQRGDTFTQTELMEISAVSIPSCSACLITGKTYGKDYLIEVRDDDSPMMAGGDDRTVGVKQRSRDGLAEALRPQYVDERIARQAMRELVPDMVRGLRPTIQEEIRKALAYHQGKIL